MMNDYKELIDVLKIKSEYNRDGSFWNESVSDSIDAAIEAIEQLVRERDAAVAVAENIYSDFLDFACTEIDNLAPYCGNRCPERIDESVWCKDVTKFCKGFSSVEYTEWRGVQE